jgi:hypothetical protein
VLVVLSGVYKWSINPFINPYPVHSHPLYRDNSIGGILRKITAHTLEAQMQNVNFAEKSLTDFDYILIAEATDRNDKEF